MDARLRRQAICQLINTKGYVRVHTHGQTVDDSLVRTRVILMQDLGASHSASANRDRESFVRYKVVENSGEIVNDWDYGMEERPPHLLYEGRSFKERLLLLSAR